MAITRTTNNIVDFTYSPITPRDSDYNSSIIGSSDCNMFIPFYSLFAHELLIFKKVNDLKVLEYKLPSRTAGRYNIARQYARLFNLLKSTQIPTRYQFTLAGELHKFGVHRGIIYKDDKILMSLAINSDYVLNTPILEIKDNPDYTKFSLIIDNNFLSNPIYKNVRKKIESIYIEECKQIGIDIVYTSRINNWIFKNNYEPPKFKSVARMVKHLNEDVSKLLVT